MNKHHYAYFGRGSTEKLPSPGKPRISVAERRARKARKQLLKLFPHLATRLHKGVTAASIYQHACTLAQASLGNGLSGNCKS